MAGRVEAEAALRGGGGRTREENRNEHLFPRPRLLAVLEAIKTPLLFSSLFLPLSGGGILTLAKRRLVNWEGKKGGKCAT